MVTSNKRHHAAGATAGTVVIGGGGGGEDPLSAPILHNIPKSILPIIHHPLNVKDYFTGLDVDIGDSKIYQQIDSIIKYFPPPAPNFASPEFHQPGGSMIPFIFPPPPPPSKYSKSQDFKVIPPLPFPPPNYMPYPLISENSSLAPTDVFKSFLDALTKLPRIDMVVASAAGSLYDMRAQADEEGFTISKHEQEKVKKLESIKREDGEDGEEEVEDGDDVEEDGEQGNEEDDDTEFQEYLEFAANVDTTNTYNKHGTDDLRTLGTKANNSFELRKRRADGYGKVNSKLSNIKNKRFRKPVLSVYDEYSESIATDMIKSLKLPLNKLPLQISGSGKDRRNGILKNLNEINDYESQHQQELYLTLKREQLAKLKELNKSKILYNGKESFPNEELNSLKEQLEERRDYELVGLKLMENYNMLNNALTFYQDSNRMYKQMNSLMMNRLLKLKNFFEYQKELFTNQLESKDTSNIFDIKTKESGKLFAGISQKDIAGYLREQLQGVEPTQSLNEFERYIPTSVLLVHDYMPLITADEFNLITGELPNHKYKTKNDPSQSGGSTNNTTTSNIKHQIFKSSLYDPITSGSDTNGSETSSIPTPKRRGRRANNSGGVGSGSNNASGNGGAGVGSGGDGSTGTAPLGERFIDGSDKSNAKYSETVLLAKIMKHYIPPQGIRPDELMSDLEKMGVQSKWPTK